MKKKNYHFVTVWQLLLMLMSFLSFQPAFAQGKYKLMRLHEPTDSVEQPVKLTKKKLTHGSLLQKLKPSILATSIL